MVFPNFSANLLVNAEELGWKITQVFDGPAAVYAAERIATTGGGADVDGYTHNQAAASTVWNITHNLNRDAVAVSIEDATGQDAEGEVNRVSANALSITFLVAMAGTAYVT